MATKYSSDRDRSRQSDRDSRDEYHQRRSRSTSRRSYELPPNTSRFHDKDLTRRGRSSRRYSREYITRSDNTLLSEEDLFIRGRNLSREGYITEDDSRLYYDDINRRERKRSFRERSPRASRLSHENLDRRRRSLSRHYSRDYITRSSDRLSREDLKRRRSYRGYYPEFISKTNSNISKYSHSDLIKKERNSSHHSRENIPKINSKVSKSHEYLNGSSRNVSRHSHENVLKRNSKLNKSSHENINRTPKNSSHSFRLFDNILKKISKTSQLSHSKTVIPHQSRSNIAKKSSIHSRLSREDVNKREQNKSARYSRELNHEIPTTSKVSNAKTFKREKYVSPYQFREHVNSSRRNISLRNSRQNFTNKNPQLKTRSFSSTNLTGRTFNTIRKSRSIEKELNVITYQDPPKISHKQRDLSNHSVTEDNLCLCPWAIFKRCNSALKKLDQRNEFPNSARTPRQYKNEIIERTQYLDIQKNSPPRSSQRKKKKKK